MQRVVRDVAARLDLTHKSVFHCIAQHKQPAHRIPFFDEYPFSNTEILEWASAENAPSTVEIIGNDLPVCGAIRCMSCMRTTRGMLYSMANKAGNS